MQENNFFKLSRDKRHLGIHYAVFISTLSPYKYYNRYKFLYLQNYFGNSDGLDTAQSSRQSSAGTGHYHHGHNNHPQHHNTQQIKGPEYALDTYIPQNSTVAPHQNNGYYQQPEPPRSNPGSPSKRVAFKGLPNQYNQHPGQHPGNAGRKSDRAYGFKNSLFNIFKRSLQGLVF